MDALFAVEAGAAFGLGHFMRCRTLARELHRRGRSLTLALRGDVGLVSRWIWPRGTGIVALPDDLEAASERVLALGQEHQPRWAIIDGYGLLGSGLLSELKRANRATLAIDDLADQTVPADLILNQNVSDAALYGDMAVGTITLLGPQFALVAEAFREVRRGGVESECASRVLVSFGGSDLRGMTPLILRSLAAVQNAVTDVDVVVGPYHVRSNLIEAENFVVRYHVAEQSLSALMAAADIVISASGTSCWETCCVGRPLIAVQTVENQRQVAAMLRRNGAAVTLDTTKDGFCQNAFATAWRNIQPMAVRSRLAAAARGLVDGLGPARVADALGL